MKRWRENLKKEEEEAAKLIHWMVENENEGIVIDVFVRGEKDMAQKQQGQKKKGGEFSTAAERLVWRQMGN